MIARLGRWCFVHRRMTVLSWLIALVAIGSLGNSVIGSNFTSEFTIPKSESSSGFDVMNTYFPGTGASGVSGSIVFRSDNGVKDPSVVATMTKMFDDVESLEGTTVISPYSIPGSRQVNNDGTVAYAVINIDNTLGHDGMVTLGKEVRKLVPSVPGLQVEVGGRNLAAFEPPKSELIGIAFAIVVLILAFGSVLAMGLPIGIALAGVGVGTSVVALLSHIFSIPDFATTIGAMIGLAVGIDYALFIVTRYRENVARGMSFEDSTVLAMDTAGRAVVFAGMTVVVSLLGMLLIGLQFMSGLGIGASTTVAVTMVASLTLLPALIGFAQHRMEITRWRGIVSAGLVSLALLGVGLSVSPLLVAGPLAVIVLLAGFVAAPLKRQLPVRTAKRPEQTLAYRWSRLIQAHPWKSVTAGGVVLLLLAAPVLSLRLGFADEGNFSPDSTTRKAYDMLADGFGPGFNGPLIAAIDMSKEPNPELLVKLSQAFAADKGVAVASPAFPNDPTAPKAAIIQVIPKTAPQDEATNRTIERLRHDVVPSVVGNSSTKVFITGSTAASADFTSYLADRLVVFIGIVLLVSFVLLMMVFRSLLVPLKAVIMNVLSIAAAYGVVVAIFQWGMFSWLINVEPAPVEPFLPIMMFAIVFGLSMDYEVFLLSRVREEFDRDGDARASVANGLAATAQVITAAAAIMIVVFGSFLLEDDRIIKMFGIGLSVAVLLDATLVRLLLVPATMELLGAKNWWLPRWIDRILPNLNVEGPSDYHVGEHSDHEHGGIGVS